jgi:Histidine kinase
MRLSRRVFVGLALIGPVVTALAVAAISIVVYHQVSENMIEKAQEILYGRLQAADQTILNVFYEASHSAGVLLFNATTAPASRQSYRENLNQLVADTPGALRAWVTFPDGTILYGPMTNKRYLERNPWWTAYRAAGMQRRMTLFTALDSAGTIGTPFRNEVNLDTIVPILVYRFDGVRPIATAFIEIDLTQVLEAYLQDFSAALDRRSGEVNLSIYSGDGTLVDTTQNIPLMQVQPLTPGSRLRLTPAELKELFAARRLSVVTPNYVELLGWDGQTGFIFDTRIPRSAIVSGVAKITFNILGIGLVSLIGIAALGVLLVRTIRRMKSFEEQQISTRLEMLQAKMNPHFLFNTLDSMVGVVARNDRETLLQMLRSLSYMLHMSVRKKEDIITLEEELEYVKSYVQLQRVRYADGFTFKLSVDETLLDYFVYRFSIQPIVENSFVHGVAEVARRRVVISLHIERVERGIRVTESDTGPGCTAEITARLSHEFENGASASHNHIGLQAVHGRLRTMHGKHYGLRLLPVDLGFAIQEMLPIIKSPPG